MIFKTATPIFYYAWLFFACGYASYRGSRVEYIGAALILVASIVSTVAFRMSETAWTGPGTSTFYVDIALLAALLCLTIVSDRYWPIWAAAFHLVAVTIHLATTVAPDVAPWALATGSAFWAYPMLLALAIGAHEYVRPVKGEGTPVD